MQKILDIGVEKQSKADILEKIKKYIKLRLLPGGAELDAIHVVSLNPENLVIAVTNANFKKVLTDAPIKIIDGVGVQIAARLLRIRVGERYPGVDLMKDLIGLAFAQRLRVALIGGRGKLAETLAECYSQSYPQATFLGLSGVTNIKNPDSDEENGLFSIVVEYMPHLVFVAFGSPDQELWIERHREHFKGMVVMGVGGAFDYSGGSVSRAPGIMRRLGLEWFFRLLRQPWRWRRQLRLLVFTKLIVKDLFKPKHEGV